MKQGIKVIAEASRIEIDEGRDKLYIVFEVIDNEYKKKLKKEWVDDIEFVLINKSLALKLENDE